MRPVVLVHGIYDTVAIFRRMKPYLERHRFPVQAIPLIPNDGRAPLDELAGQLDAQVRAAFGAGETIHLVGFSMGGLVSRYYVQRLGGIQRVGKFITIGTPHRGTRTAFLHSGMGARNMRPGSAFLQDLNRDVEMLERVSFASIWTPLDLMILPASSSRIEVGRSFPVRTLLHPLLVHDGRVLRLVLKILNE